MDNKNSAAKTENHSKGIIGAGLLTAFAASLCRITPVLAMLSGAAGIASTFSWMGTIPPLFDRNYNCRIRFCMVSKTKA